MFFTLGFDLLARNRIAGPRVYGFQRNYVVTAETRDRTRQHRLDVLPLTDLTTDIARDAIVRRAAHESQCFTDALVGKQIQKRCLSEVHRECLLERSVENGLTCCVDEISQQNCVALGERI